MSRIREEIEKRDLKLLFGIIVIFCAALLSLMVGFVVYWTKKIFQGREKAEEWLSEVAENVIPKSPTRLP